MNKKLKQILNRYPMLEKDRNYIANLVDGGTNNTDKNVFICIINQNAIDNLSESFINTLKSISDLVSYDNPTLISADIAHNILDLNAKVFDYRGGTLKVNKNHVLKAKNPLAYFYNGTYVNMEVHEGFKDKGYNVYGIIANDEYLLQIIHVINENAFEHLGEGFNKLGFYIQNYIPT